MDKKEVLLSCKSEGFFLDREMLDFFVGLSEEKFVLVLNELKKLGISEKILTKKVFDDNKDKISCFFSKSDVKNVKILKNFEKKNKKVENSDFFEYFRQRFELLKDILVKKGFDNLISIRRIGSSNGVYTVIGMIYSKRITKNKNLLFEIEDLGGRTIVLVNRDNKKLFDRAQKLVEDDVLAFQVSGSSKMLFANEFIFPDFEKRDEVFGEKDEYCVFTGDFHVGSELFLESNLRKFVDWLNGGVGDERQRAISGKVKYLFLVGDLVEGVGIYPGQEKFLKIKGCRAQYKKVFDVLKGIRDDIEIIMCPGLHDAVWLGEPQPKVENKWLVELDGMKNLRRVSNPCELEVGGLKVFLNYGINMKSFLEKLEKKSSIKEFDDVLKRRSLPLVYSESDFVPGEAGDLMLNEMDVFVVGGRHKAEVGNYGNIVKISTSCWQKKSDYEAKMGMDVDFARVPILNLKSKEVKILDFSGNDEILWEKGDDLVCELCGEEKSVENKKKIKIAIDIDEVLAEQLESVVEFYKQETGVFIPKEKFSSYNWWETWGISKEEAIGVDGRFKESDMFESLRVVEGSIEAIEKLNKDNSLVVITARPSDFENKTLGWLGENYGDSFDEVLHSSDFHVENGEQKSKVEFCKDLGVDLIIEDNLEYSLKCAEGGIKVLLLDKPWNQGDLHENIFRCGDWGEILKKVEVLKNG
ncbi:hypothetical protein HNV12_04265 [Methanococcoides sp. SA1]|nr:hypothetical protein [Methanococcoides sp. SA1]